MWVVDDREQRKRTCRSEECRDEDTRIQPKACTYLVNLKSSCKGGCGVGRLWAIGKR